MADTGQSTGLALIGSTALGAVGVAGGQPLSVPLPFANRIVLIDDTHIAGTTHIPGIDEIVAEMSEGQELALERDVGNLHDVWAIRVMAGAERIGWIPCDRNEILARLMDGGKRIGAKVTAMEKRGHWNKIHLEVYLDD